MSCCEKCKCACKILPREHCKDHTCPCHQDTRSYPYDEKELKEAGYLHIKTETPAEARESAEVHPNGRTMKNTDILPHPQQEWEKEFDEKFDFFECSALNIEELRKFISSLLTREWKKGWQNGHAAALFQAEEVVLGVKREHDLSCEDDDQYCTCGAKSYNRSRHDAAAAIRKLV